MGDGVTFELRFAGQQRATYEVMRMERSIQVWDQQALRWNWPGVSSK